MRVFFMKKAFIVIDGSNFYFKLKKMGLSHLLSFDYGGFIKWLARKNKISECCFYIGRIREEAQSDKSKNLKRDQDRLLALLKNHGINTKTGYILKTKDVYHEKGVDVQIAVDICLKAVRHEYDQLILISSDTDLIPAIKEVQRLKKSVEYVGFDDNPSFAMIRFSNSRTLLKKEDFTAFIKK